MKRKPLGRTGELVTEICLGTMTWGSQNTEAEGHAQIEMALDHGIDFMDTAELYAVPPRPQWSGRTEEIIGSWFKKTGRRNDWFVASKIGGGGTAHIRGGARPDKASVLEAVDNSLKRLGTDRIDLYQVHWAARGSYNFENGWTFKPHTHDIADTRANLLETLEGLGRAVEQGKVRHVGLSNETAWGMGQYLTLSERHGLPRVASIQNEYSLIRRQFDLDLAEVCHHEGIGLLAYSALGAGLLTGKYAGGVIPPGSRADFQNGLWRMNDYSAAPVAEYLALAHKHGLDPAQMAIAFGLSRPFMTSVIIGATSTLQLANNIAAADLTLSPDVLAEIDAIHRRFPRPI
jgi:aryl-alcohol dehydrogenase-like predicted oxidoreductase